MFNKSFLPRWHWISGLTISFFFLLHIGNHLAALWDVEAHLEYMKAVRRIYRNVVVESILLIAILVQAISGIQLVRRLRKQEKSSFEKIRVYSGLYLAFFLIVHTSAILIFRTKGVDTNFYFGVLGFLVSPATFVFIPYYSLGVLSVFLHLGATHYFKIQSIISEHRARTHAVAIMLTGLLVAGLIVYGFIESMQGRPIPPEYLKLTN